MKRITGWLMGRSTTFCAGFFVTGNVMHYLHRLDGTYITFMGTLLGFVVGHSVKEDYFAKQSKPDGN
jgi:hypothetical protein